jgi:hypothetical protein
MLTYERECSALYFRAASTSKKIADFFFKGYFFPDLFVAKERRVTRGRLPRDEVLRGTKTTPCVAPGKAIPPN